MFVFCFLVYVLSIMFVLRCFIVLSRDCVVFVFYFLVYDEGDLVTAVFLWQILITPVTQWFLKGNTIYIIILFCTALVLVSIDRRHPVVSIVC